MLRFAIVSAHHDEDWHSQRFEAALRQHGWVDVVSPSQVILEVTAGKARVAVDRRDAREWDAWLLARALGEDGDPDFQLTTYQAISDLGVPVVNGVTALLIAEDKIRCSFLLARALVPTPAAVAVQSLPAAMSALASLKVAVVKPPYGSLGEGVAKVSTWDRDSGRVLRDVIERHGVIYLQRFVRARRARQDLRLFVVGDSVAAGMARVARPGEFRTNIHLGGSPLPYRPSAAVEQVAVRAARAVGLEYAGVDIIDAEEGPLVIEVNGTPRWEGILRATGRDMAEVIAAHAVSLARKGRSEGGGSLDEKLTRAALGERDE
ncbi:MAG: RimK family alpha-L-glutamate ligase [Deltaproteobacteria bacterium]|nr:RimK family alpha-L-glutamate ligase [Deltaproteobacteria bacterium]